MRRFWARPNRKLRRRLAACAIGCCSALASAQSYAMAAYDDASDPVYADGWQGGDNGGSGFTPWDFSSAYVFNGTWYNYANSNFHAIDDGLQNGTHYSNPFNDVGRAWALGKAPDNDGTVRAGRGFSLAIGETLKIVFDNPTQRQFFKGYYIRLNGNTGGVDGNIMNLGYGSTPAATPVNMLTFQTFEYFSSGEWSLIDAASTQTGQFDTDTAAAGAILSVTRTGAGTYDFAVDSLGGGTDLALSRTFDNLGPHEVDWIEFVFFSALTDTNEPPRTATDFYIRSMEITAPEPGTAVLVWLGLGGVLVARRRRGA